MSKIETSRAIARQVRERLDRPRVAVRSAFIASEDPETPPPMTQLMRGGRGGEVKLKLLLSMLWIAVPKGNATKGRLLPGLISILLPASTTSSTFSPIGQRI